VEVVVVAVHEGLEPGPERRPTLNRLSGRGQPHDVLGDESGVPVHVAPIHDGPPFVAPEPYLLLDFAGRHGIPPCVRRRTASPIPAQKDRTTSGSSTPSASAFRWAKMPAEISSGSSSW